MFLLFLASFVASALAGMWIEQIEYNIHVLHFAGFYVKISIITPVTYDDGQLS